MAIGRRTYRDLTRKRRPSSLTQASQGHLLGVILGNERTAQTVLAAAGGDLRRLDGMEIQDLAALPGVGEATAARIAALFALMERLLQPAETVG